MARISVSKMRPVSFSQPLFADAGIILLTVAAVWWLYDHAQAAVTVEQDAPGTWNFFSDTVTQTVDETIAQPVADFWTDTQDTILSTVADVTGQFSRGLRNNNPGDIERDGDAWEGMAPTQTDARYITFSAPIWGIRAMARILDNYAKRGKTTVRQIVQSWAPPSENNTENYIRAVARAVGGETVEPTKDRDTFALALAAMIVQENSYNPYSHDLILSGIDLARGVTNV